MYICRQNVQKDIPSDWLNCIIFLSYFLPLSIQYIIIIFYNFVSCIINVIIDVQIGTSKNWQHMLVIINISNNVSFFKILILSKHNI